MAKCGARRIEAINRKRTVAYPCLAQRKRSAQQALNSFKALAELEGWRKVKLNAYADSLGLLSFEVMAIIVTGEIEINADIRLIGEEYM
jgi:hypothetical protein